MLLCVCLNPAVDVTYDLPAALKPGESQRVAKVRHRAGGKAVNVARVAQQLGQPVAVLAPVGGANGGLFREKLGLPAHLVDIEGETRRTLSVVDPEGATLLNEPGPTLTPTEWERLTAGFAKLLPSARLVVMSGSLPPGAPVDAYAQLIRSAHGTPTIVDGEGPALRAALTEKPYLIKPNLAELASVGGEIGRARELGAENVVVSMGAQGLLAVTEDGCRRATGPSVPGNATGAGDALVAALAVGALRGTTWPERLREAVAWSGAAVASPVAGEVDRPTHDRLAPEVTVVEQ